VLLVVTPLIQLLHTEVLVVRKAQAEQDQDLMLVMLVRLVKAVKVVKMQEVVVLMPITLEAEVVDIMVALVALPQFHLAQAMVPLVVADHLILEV
jgi:hypothetical protein